MEGDFIGTDATGTKALGNAGEGVEIDALNYGPSTDNTIGGTSAIAGNLITDNGGPGVAVTGVSSVGNQITANRIFANTGQAIDLGDDGVTYNAASPRQGPNNLQNFPIIVATADGQTEGWLGGSESDTTFRIDFFASAGYGPGGAGEAQDYLGSLQETTNAAGAVTFAVPFTAPAGLPIITATAIDPQGNTSEVSALRRAVLHVPARSVRVTPGQSVVFSTTSGDGIAIQDPDAGPLNPVWSLTLSVAAGTLTLSSTAGLTGSGDGTGSLSYSGPLAALDAALDGMIFNPHAGPHVFTTLTLGAQSFGAQQPQTQIVITDGVFVVTTTADSGPGSLRQAILDSDLATSGGNTIDFAIPGPGVQTIAPASPLPAITNSVLIDGTSQPGYNGTPLIAIDASSSGMADGLTITGSDLTVRGLADDGFALGTVSLSGQLTVQSGPLQVSDGGNADRVDTYRIDTSGDGRLLAQLQTQGLTTRLSLLDYQGRVLVQSDGISPTNPDDQIDQHLPAGTYFLQVVTTGVAGEWALTAALTPASPPFQVIPVASFITNPGYDPLAVGDFNGDGIPDLAAMDGIHLGLGDGTFQEPLASLGLSADNPSLQAMVTGDFNGDGKLDLAVEYTGGGTIAVLLGNGDGTFQAPKFYAVGNALAPGGRGAGNTLVAGDFSGDGRLDLAVDDNDGVQILLGNGDGTFQAPETFAAGTRPAALVAGDFSGDGRLDLATANDESNDVSVLMGNGDGTFQPAIEYAAGIGPDALVAGDFNGDGRLDLAVAGSGVQILLGNGDGTFQAAEAYAAGATPPSSLVAGDFTGDGQLDLAVTGQPLGNISMLLGNGDGTFQAPSTIVVGVDAYTLVAGDFNGDGRLDLAIADYKNDDIAVLLNKGDGTFLEAPQPNVAGKLPNAIAAGDFSGDGRLDLAVANRLSSDVFILLGNGDGTFQPAVQYAAASGRRLNRGG